MTKSNSTKQSPIDTEPSSIMMAIGGEDGLPQLSQGEDFGEAGDQLLEIAESLINAGFQGIRCQSALHKSGKATYALQFDPDTPEGGMFARLDEGVRRGIAIPTVAQVMAALLTLRNTDGGPQQ